VALFLAKANVSMQAVCNRSFRILVRRTFNEGWECHVTSADLGITMDPLAMNQTLTAVCAHLQTKLLGVFSQSKYVGVSIDGVTIKCRKFEAPDLWQEASNRTFLFRRKSEMK
jgi:hypothetical protein